MAHSVRLMTIPRVCPFSAAEGTKAILGEATILLTQDLEKKNFVIKPRLLLTKMKPSKRNVIYFKQNLLYRRATFIRFEKEEIFRLQALDFKSLTGPLWAETRSTLYVFLGVIPQRLNFICRQFGTLFCIFVGT